ncbi:MAG: FlxA-like family protein [Endomicrobium sp.]|nr:FlxA-like family protein [Endomicrobium sp.]
MSKIIGATNYNELLTDPAKAAAFYLEHGDKSYNELMKLMFGSNATLTHEQSIAFAETYKIFLDQSIKGLSKKVSENKAGDIQSDIDKLNDEIKNLEASIASESDDKKKKNLQSQLDAKRGQLAQKQAALPAGREEQQKLLALLGDAAYALAVIQKVQNILSDPRYNPVGGPGAIISGEIGQVLVPSIPIDVSGKDLPAGEYYLVITVTASYAGTREIQYGGANDKKDIPQYKVAKNDLGYSVSTIEGCTVTLSDGSQYKVFGVHGEFQGQQVIFQYDGYYQESTGKFYMSSTANIYLMDDKGSVYQKKDDPSASPTSSGKYGDVAPDRDNWSRGVITEDDNGYRISGAGSRITIRKNAASGEWKAVIVGIGTDALAGSNLKLGAKDKFGKDNSVYIEVKAGKMTYAGSYWAVSDGMSWKFDSRTTQAQAEAYVTTILSNQLGADKNKDFVENVKLISGDIDINTIFYGVPFSALTIMHECHLEFSVELKKGYVYDATSQGDIYKATFEQDTIVTIKEKDSILKYIATSAVAISVELPDGWKFENGSTSMNGVVINAGQEISLGSVLFNKKISIQNTEDLEVVIGYEERSDGSKDDDGNPRLDYSKPITTKIGKGKLKVTGNADSDYITNTTIYINFTDKGWDVLDGTSNFYWESGAKLNLTRIKEKDGKITYRMSIVKGDLYVKDLNGVHVPKGDGGDKAKPKYKGPTFKGKVGSASSDGNGGYIYGDITGVFKGVSGVGLTKDGLGSYLYAPGSELEARSYAPDGTKSKYAFYVKDDGSIKQIGVKWYDKLWGAIKAIFKIILSVVFVFVLAPLVLAFLPLLLPIAGVALGLSFGLAKNKTLDFFKKTIGNIFKDWFASIYDDWNLREGPNHNTETAWKGGLAMVSAGFMAIVTAAIAIASIIAAIPSGGMSIAGGVAAIVGMVSAIAGAIQVGQMAYQAVLALSYGDLKNGFLMLGMSILLGVITVLGARGVGSAISKGLESVAFVLKSAAVGSVAGLAVGAGVGALGNYIAHGIMTGEWSGEGAAKAAGEGAISGAIAGFFAGASMGINIASSIVKQAARETAQAAAKGAAQGATEGVAGGTTQAAARGVTTVAAEATSQAVGSAVGVGAEATAEAAGKTVGSVLAQEAAQGVSVSFSEGVSLLGRSVKEFFVGVSFVPFEGIKSAVINVGRAISHAFSVIFKVVSMALDLYISYQAANTMVDAIRKGDEDSIKQFFSAAWTLISINLIAPFMVGQSGIQSKRDMIEVAKAEVNTEQMEKIVQTPTDAINKMSRITTAKAELGTMFSNGAWLGNIGTGVVGAGLGLAAVYLIAWATKGEDEELHVSWKENSSWSDYWFCGWLHCECFLSFIW